ncbi:hypothetical protein EON67_02920 [archaeon]|nr:MAG: hypothetical protein EON67_02920 [archaeon]
MSHALTVAQLECVLSAVTHYRLVDRAFLVFEHAVHAGIAPTAPMITSVCARACACVRIHAPCMRPCHPRLHLHAPQAVRAFFTRPLLSIRVQMLHAAALKCAGRPAHEVHDTYAAALQLIAASGVRIDNEIACGLLGLLLDEAHTPAFRHLKSVAADRALPLPVAAEAATTATAASEPLLKEAFKLVAHLTDAELTHGRVLPLLMTLCMRHGRRDRALQLLGSMQARGVHIPTRCFNQLILSDGVSSMESVSVYLRLMADMGITPTEDTLLALVKVRMYAHGSKGGSVEFAQQLSTALHVPLDSRALGTIAFYALNCGALGDVNECMQAVATLPREAGAPPPRWMRKLSSLLAARLAQSTAAVRSKDRA